MKPTPALTQDEKESARPFLGRRSDKDIAKLMKRAEGLIRNLRNSLGIPPKPSGRPVGVISRGGKVVLCSRCQVVKFITRLRKGEPVETVCRWCRGEIEAAREEGMHRWNR
jgi:hypothetical protein